MEKKENIELSEGAIRLQVPFSGLIYHCDLGIPLSPIPLSFTRASLRVAGERNERE
jgi:hypothetical protein